MPPESASLVRISSRGREVTLALALALGGTHASGVSLHGDQLRDLLRRALDRRPEVLEAYLFGSRARGGTQAHSDVDVAVYVAHVPDAPFGYAAELGAELMSALGENLVDVVLLNHAPPLLYREVLRDGVRLLSRDPKATTVREGRALSRYCDYLPQLAKLDAIVRRRVERGEFGR